LGCGAEDFELWKAQWYMIKKSLILTIIMNLTNLTSLGSIGDGRKKNRTSKALKMINNRDINIARTPL